MSLDKGINSDQSILLWSKPRPFCPIAHMSSVSLSFHLSFMYGAVCYPCKANWILTPCSWSLCVLKNLCPSKSLLFIQSILLQVFFLYQQKMNQTIYQQLHLKYCSQILSNAFIGQREMRKQEIESKGVDQYSLQNPGKNHTQLLSGFSQLFSLAQVNTSANVKISVPTLLTHTYYLL